jgi:hypothetical protein
MTKFGNGVEPKEGSLMTDPKVDPKVKQALLDLVGAIRTLSTLVAVMNNRLYDVEDRLDGIQYGGNGDDE